MRTGLVADATDVAGMASPAEMDAPAEAVSPVEANTPVGTRAAEAAMGMSRRETPTPFWPFSAR